MLVKCCKITIQSRNRIWFSINFSKWVYFFYELIRKESFDTTLENFSAYRVSYLWRQRTRNPKTESICYKKNVGGKKVTICVWICSWLHYQIKWLQGSFINSITILWSFWNLHQTELVYERLWSRNNKFMNSFLTIYTKNSI